MSDEDKDFEEIAIPPNIVDSAIQAGIEIANVKTIPRESGETTTVLVPDGFTVQTIKNERQNPSRKTGSRVFLSAKSFCSYVNKHKDADATIIVADEHKAKIIAYLNDHTPASANWADFTAQFDVGFSKQWLTWFKRAYSPDDVRDRAFDQAAFVDFLENNRSDIMTSGVKDEKGEEIKTVSFLELSSLLLNLQITVDEKLTSEIDPRTGTTRFHYENQEKKGSVVIPSEFYLALPIYKTGKIYQVKIRIRYRKSNSKIVFFYLIDQAEKLIEAAFDDICRKVEVGNAGSENDPERQFPGTGIEVLRGVL
jgi:uncharacterized protein YfdQ (DUF2303 family)